MKNSTRKKRKIGFNRVKKKKGTIKKEKKSGLHTKKKGVRRQSFLDLKSSVPS